VSPGADEPRRFAGDELADAAFGKRDGEAAFAAIVRAFATEAGLRQADGSVVNVPMGAACLSQCPQLIRLPCGAGARFNAVTMNWRRVWFQNTVRSASGLLPR
jgi:hypothetical protein